jgi:hypothetical protein
MERSDLYRDTKLLFYQTCGNLSSDSSDFACILMLGYDAGILQEDLHVCPDRQHGSSGFTVPLWRKQARLTVTLLEMCTALVGTAAKHTLHKASHGAEGKIHFILWRIYPLQGNDSVYTFQRAGKVRTVAVSVIFRKVQTETFIYSEITIRT